MEFYFSLNQQSKVFVSECPFSTWGFRNPGSLYVEAVPISRASSSSVSIKWKKENVKMLYLFLKSVNLKVEHYWLEISYRATPASREPCECGLANMPNYNRTMRWESGIWGALQFLTLQVFAVSAASSLSSVLPFLGLMFYLVGSILLFLDPGILWRKSITWVFGEIKVHILPNSPLLLRTHRCP